MRTILILRLIVALGAGTVIAVLGATGSIMAFEPELDHLLHRQRWYVTPRSTTWSLEKLGEAAARTQPGQPPRG